MIKYTYQGKEECLKNLFSEITIEEFEKTAALNEGTQFYAYYLDAFEILGFSKELCDSIDTDNLIEIIKDFKKIVKQPKKLKHEFKLDGHTYEAFDAKSSVNARDFADVQKLMYQFAVNNDYKWVSEAMAIIFKRTDLSATEHKDKSHREEKANLFKIHMTMDYALPYVDKLSAEYIKNIKLFNE